MPDTKTSFFRAAVLEETNKPLAIYQEIAIPPLGPGQVLVEIAYSGICRSQLMEVQGARGPDRYLPHLLGHEATGRVREVGPGVTKVKIGEAVVLGWIKGQGLEGGPTKFRSGAQTINSGSVTTFSTFSVVSENRLVALPAGYGFDEGVLFGCALLTGAGIVLNELELSGESQVVIWGLGGIGMSALLAALAVGCRSVVAIDREPTKVALAKKYGATHGVVFQGAATLAELTKICPQGFDAAIEATGTIEGIELAFASVKKQGGECVFASHPPSGEKISLDPHELISGKRIRGSWGGACDPDRDVPRLAKLLTERRISLRPLLSEPFPLEQVNEALAELARGQALRVVLALNSAIAEKDQS